MTTKPDPMPRVSVVIPCYNQARFLPEAVASVVAQTMADWEILIVDDGSPDDTAVVGESLIAANPQRRITLLRQPNQGLAASRNNGIRQARGAFILTLDADDIIEPEMLAATAAVLDQHPAVGFVYTDVQRFGEEQTVLRSVPYSLKTLRFDCILMPASLFRRAAWAQTSGFDGEMAVQGYEDWDFWLRLGAAGWQGYHLARPLLRYRRSAGSMLGKARKYDLELRARLVLNHAALYEPDVVAWARHTLSPRLSAAGALRSWRHWLLAYLSYCAVIARHQPQMLAKAVLRPLFWRMPVRRQGSLRGVLRLLRLS